MAAGDKPSTGISWPCSNPGSSVTDPGSLGNSGWASGNKPAAEHFNWLFQKLTDLSTWVLSYAAGLTLNNTFSGANKVTGSVNCYGGAAAESAPLIFDRTLDVGGEPRRILLKNSPGFTTEGESRVYIDAVGSIEIAYGCYWDGSVWKPLGSGTGWGFFLEVHKEGGKVLYGFNRTAETSWNTNQWTVLIDESKGYTKTISFDTLANPATDTAQKNISCPKNTCKVWGTVSLGTNPTVAGGYNLASAAYQDNHILRITFAQAMDYGNFSVAASLSTSVAHMTQVFVQPVVVSSSVVDLYVFDKSGSAITLSSAFDYSDAIHFQVFGTQAL